MANITDHQQGESWRPPTRPELPKTKFCVTELSSASLLIAGLGVSASLWAAIAAVVW